MLSLYYTCYSYICITTIITDKRIQCNCMLSFVFQKICRECERCFCSNCVHRLSLKGQNKETFRQCKKCRILLTGTFTRQELVKWKVKDLKCLLMKRNISTDGCREKQELIDLIVINFGHMTRNDDVEERSVSI